MGANAIKMRFLAAAAIIALLATPLFGMSFISPACIFDPACPEFTIFWSIRLPRAVGSFLAGSGLAIGGLIFQTMFLNPLATPFTLGISSGAALGASLYFRFGGAAVVMGMAGALASSLAGSFASMLLVYAITRARGGFSTSVMLLAGVIISFLFSSLVMFVQYSSNAHDAMQIMRWLMGSIAAVEAPMLLELCAVVLPGAWLVSRMAAELDLLTAGEEIAASRGVEARRVKLRCFVIASVIVGAIVSVTGPIGFVGMMAPQICRLWLGWRMRDLVPASFLMGGMFLAFCDLGARSLLAPVELPIGIITSMLGAPFFLWTLFRSNRSGEMS